MAVSLSIYKVGELPIMSLKRDAETGLILRKNGGGLCRTCCGSEPQYAVGTGCCSFLDPDPDPWSPTTIYSEGQSVRYNSQNYFSIFNGNIGHTPGTDGWWLGYLDCGNENWNSCPPYGGPGKTPLIYHVSHTYESAYYERTQIEVDLLHNSSDICYDIRYRPDLHECLCMYSNCVWIAQKNVVLIRKSDQTEVTFPVIYFVYLHYNYLGTYYTVIGSSLFSGPDTIEICRYDPQVVFLCDDTISGTHTSGLQTITWSPK